MQRAPELEEKNSIADHKKSTSGSHHYQSEAFAVVAYAVRVTPLLNMTEYLHDLR